MNIVKFKDIILTADNAPQLSEEQRDIFNSKFKAKYAYAINWEDVVSLDDLTLPQYVYASTHKYIDTDVICYNKIKEYWQLLDSDGHLSASDYYIVFPDMYSVDEDGKGRIKINKNRFAGTLEEGGLKNAAPDVTFDIETYNNSIPNDIEQYIQENCNRFKILPPNDYLFVRNDSFFNDDIYNEDTRENLGFIKTVYDKKTRDVNIYISKGRMHTDIYEASAYAFDGDEEEWDKYITICEDHSIEMSTMPTPVFANIYSNDVNNICIIIDNITTGERKEIFFSLLDNRLDDPVFNIEDMGSTQYGDEHKCVLYSFSTFSTPQLISEFTRDYSNPDAKGRRCEALRYCWCLCNKPTYTISGGYPNDIYTGFTKLQPYGYYLGGAGFVNNKHLPEIRIFTSGSVTENRFLSGDDNTDSVKLYALNYDTKTTYFPYLFKRNIQQIKSLNDDYLHDIDNIPFNLLEDYVDNKRTDDSNDVTKYISYNNFTPDDDITLDELKRFRTWLAELLLEAYGVDLEEKTHNMLTYYANEMSDETIKHLEQFGYSSAYTLTGTTTGNKTACSCQNAYSLLNNVTSINTGCDPIYMYRKGIYEYMVSIFRDISFWTALDNIYLTEIKKYIDNIIKLNLPLTASPYVSELYDCGCLTTADTPQNRMMQILRNLSQSLQYMIDDDMSSHRNFIGDTLYEWASKLYEIMRWV